MSILESFYEHGIVGVIIVVSIAIVAFIMKSLFLHLLNKNFEKYKSDQQEHQENINALINRHFEEYQMLLAKQLNEHQIRFSSLHQERAFVIRELYKMIVNTEIEKDQLISGFDEIISESIKQKEEIDQFYKENKILFDSKTCSAIEIFLNVFDRANSMKKILKTKEFSHLNEESFWQDLIELSVKNESKEKLNFRSIKLPMENKESDIIPESIPSPFAIIYAKEQLLILLESKFREILGVTEFTYSNSNENIL